MRFPTEPTTPQQWTAIAWAMIVICVAMAGLAFYGAFRGGAPDVGAQLRTTGFVCIGAAIAVFIIKKLIAMFLDS